MMTMKTRKKMMMKKKRTTKNKEETKKIFFFFLTHLQFTYLHTHFYTINLFFYSLTLIRKTCLTDLKKIDKKKRSTFSDWLPLQYPSFFLSYFFTVTRINFLSLFSLFFIFFTLQNKYTHTQNVFTSFTTTITFRSSTTAST